MKQSRSEVQKRHKQILDFVNQNGTCQVQELGELLNVSEITIRRDLSLLESKGLLLRYHGGATPAAPVEETPVFENKNTMNFEQKVKIAKVVNKLVKDNDTVFLNAGSTTLEIIRELKSKNVKIVTNNALASSVVDGSSAARLICTGGEYNAKNQSYSGDLATALMNKIYGTVCILGVNGINSTDGITTSDYLETMINDLFIKRCKGTVIVAADGSKIGLTYCFTSAAIASVDIIVTDSSANAAELERLKECGIQIILAD